MVGSSRRERSKTRGKISGMKRRSSSRDSPPVRTKRSRSSVGRYDDSSDERITPDRIRRRSRVRSPPSPRRYGSPVSHRSEYRSRDIQDRSYPSYKVLCVSALHPKASDEVIKDTLYREYRKFGDLSIRISHDLDERVAYVCFRNTEDARDAKRNKPRIILFDKVALVEAVYESRSSSDAYRPRSRPRSRSLTPEHERYYRSPEHRPPDRAYDRMYGPPPMMPYRDYRHEVPPMHHHDFIRGPPMHHAIAPHMPPVPPHHYGPPRHMIHGFRPPPPHFDKPENKKDKFPNYLQHIPPEDDPLATRTLFAGNLEINISDEELRRIFGRYGVVEDIDIKRPLPGTGNAYAFVKYQNLDMAHRSKVELSGQYIGKFQCKIGYGKATPTTRIWVGGLGTWTSLAQLEREFDRFGAIKKIDYMKGDNQAYILYDSIDAATAAVKEMRGFPLGGPERKLRVDFADVNPPPPKRPPPPPPPPPEETTGEFRGREGYPYEAHYDSWVDGEYGQYTGSRGYRGRGGTWPEGRRGGRGYRGYEEEWRRDEYERYKRAPSGERSPSETPNGHLGSARTLSDLAKKCDSIWSGALVLKNSLFPAKFHLTDGDVDIIDALMKDEEGKPLLRITQRLRLDQPKLEDVSKRIAGSTSHAIFLGLSGPATVPPEDSGVQTRPLRNLVSYLKQKEAAGVISLVNKDTEVTGVLYAFPPCPFSSDLLKRTAHNLSQEGLKEDHLVIVVVRGGTA